MKRGKQIIISCSEKEREGWNKLAVSQDRSLASLVRVYLNGLVDREDGNECI